MGTKLRKNSQSQRVLALNLGNRLTDSVTMTKNGMGFFSKLFGKSDLRQEAEQQIKDIQREWRPINELYWNLYHAACQATRDVKPYCTPKKLAEPIHEFLLRQEFLYFLLHITQSLAHGLNFTPSERDDLCEILVFEIDFSMGEVPEACRSESREVTIHNANVAEMDYASSKEVYPIDDPETLGDSVYAKLARKIEEKLGREHNFEIARQIILATSRQLRAANIPNLLREIRPNLHKHAEISRSAPF